MQTKKYAFAVVMWLLFITFITAASLVSAGEARSDGYSIGPAARVVGIAAHGEFDGTGSTIYRVWNDGLVEVNRARCDGCGWAGWVIVPDG
jgi:hypothetical protein